MERARTPTVEELESQVVSDSPEYGKEEKTGTQLQYPLPHILKRPSAIPIPQVLISDTCLSPLSSSSSPTSYVQDLLNMVSSIHSICPKSVPEDFAKERTEFWDQCFRKWNQLELEGVSQSLKLTRQDWFLLIKAVQKRMCSYIDTSVIKEAHGLIVKLYQQLIKDPGSKLNQSLRNEISVKRMQKNPRKTLPPRLKNKYHPYQQKERSIKSFTEEPPASQKHSPTPTSQKTFTMYKELEEDPIEDVDYLLQKHYAMQDELRKAYAFIQQLEDEEFYADDIE